MCSAYDTEQDRQHARVSGIDDFLPKPINRKSL